MFKCLVDCLTRPRNIAQHVNMKTIKFIGYFFLLVLISTVPSVVVNTFNPGISENFATTIVNDLQSIETTYHYIVVENTLIDTTGNNEIKIIGINNFASISTDIDPGFKTYILFNPGDEKAIVKNEKAPYFAINLGSKEITLSLEMPLLDDSNKEQMSSKELEFKYTYEKLGVNNLDFSELNSYSTYGVQMKVEKIIDAILKPYMPVIYLISIPSLFLTTASSIAIEIVILSALVFFFVRASQLRFMEIVKIITLSMTPSVFASIFLILPVGAMGYYIIYIIGQILTISYFYRAIRQLVINKMIK